MVVGLLLAFASVPLVFHKEAARWFNARYVTGDEPDWAAVETLFEIGRSAPPGAGPAIPTALDVFFSTTPEGRYLGLRLRRWRKLLGKTRDRKAILFSTPNARFCGGRSSLA